MNKYLVLLAVVCLIACQEQNVHHEEQMITTTANQDDVITVSLLHLDTKAPSTHQITLSPDPVLKAEKKYLAYDLKSILQPYVQQLDSAQFSSAVVTFICKDGYRPNQYLKSIWNHEGYLVFKDLDAKDGEYWTPQLVASYAPFYLVWKGETLANKKLKWPYGLTTIEIRTTDTMYDAIKPKGDHLALSGFKQFERYCIKCHAVNKLGGQMGPDLNHPKNILDYWRKEDIWQFAKNPQSYRYNSKMPPMTALQPEEFESIVAYWTYMKDHKLSEVK